jgi:bacillithiol system protein YtxJ
MYRVLVDESDTETLIASATPAWLLKHSNTCPISTAALDEFTKFLTNRPGDAAGMLVVQTQRLLSTWVAERLKFTHQSPQLFLVRGGRVLWHASHWSITHDAMAEAIAHPTVALRKSGIIAAP